MRVTGCLVSSTDLSRRNFLHLWTSSRDSDPKRTEARRLQAEVWPIRWLPKDTSLLPIEECLLPTPFIFDTRLIRKHQHYLLVLLVHNSSFLSSLTKFDFATFRIAQKNFQQHFYNVYYRLPYAFLQSGHAWPSILSHAVFQSRMWTCSKAQEYPSNLPKRTVSTTWRRGEIEVF